ncbi:cardiolipin synthase [Pediococcus argentinicus]|uniref:cardiolipin synthase n=1 Tax=Pediococcus argentinicus TaxID=480391 RepID=UPI0033904CCC
MIWIEIGLYLLNTLIAITIALFERRDIAAAWAWMLVMFLLPGVGLLAYMFLGRKLSSNQIFDIRAQQNLGVSEMARYQKESSANHIQLESPMETELVNLFLNTDDAILTHQNEVMLLNDGKRKFKQLFSDLKHARHNINIEYFTIYNDDLGQHLRDILVQKAKAGVRIKVMYDLFGSKGSKTAMFKELIENGGEVIPFMRPRFSYLNFRINFRNHRKIVVIDGSIGYIGGFNVGDQYVGQNSRFGYLRDTHLRITGSAVLQLQSRFFMDWNASNKKNTERIDISYFPQNEVHGNVPIQIVSSGPESEIQKIKQGYIKMIAAAQSSIKIETPYFIPDDALMEILLIAIRTGIHVTLVIPNQPDHFFVYRTTEYYAQQLVAAGADVYMYQKGFMHVKTIIVDEKVVSVGSANLDIRSFKLNFEANAFIYNQQIAQQVGQDIKQDINDSELLTEHYFKNQSNWTKIKQQFSRLLSPIL